MESAGFVFGIMGMMFAIIAWSHIGALDKKFEAFKKRIEDSGVLKD